MQTPLSESSLEEVLKYVNDGAVRNEHEEEVYEEDDQEDDGRSSHTSLGSEDSHEAGKRIQKSWGYGLVQPPLTRMAEIEEKTELNDELSHLRATAQEYEHFEVHESSHQLPDIPEIATAMDDYVLPREPYRATSQWRSKVRTWVNTLEHMPHLLWSWPQRLSQERWKRRISWAFLVALVVIFSTLCTLVLADFFTPLRPWSYAPLSLDNEDGLFVNNTFVCALDPTTRYELHTRIDGLLILMAIDEKGVQWMGRKLPHAVGQSEEWYLRLGGSTTKLFNMTPPQTTVNWYDSQLEVQPWSSMFATANELQLVSTTTTLWSLSVFYGLLSQQNVSSLLVGLDYAPLSNWTRCTDYANICLPALLGANWLFPSSLEEVCIVSFFLGRKRCAHVPVLEPLASFVPCSFCEV